MTEACPFSPFDPTVMADPYEYFAWLRANAPVYEVPNAGYFAISRYQDIKEICKNPAIFSSVCTGFLRRDKGGQIRVMDTDTTDSASGLELGAADAPHHTRHRGPLSKTVAPRVRQLEGWLRDLCETVLDSAINRGSMDFMEEYASLVSSRAVSHLIGLPPEDAKQLESWSAVSAQIIGGVSSDAELMENGTAILDFRQYLADKLSEAREFSGDNVMGDLCTLMRSSDNDLTEGEILGILFQLVVGAHETTAAIIGCALQMSEYFPDIYADVQTDHALIPNYLEEIIRLETPAQGNYRKTTRETVLAGVRLPKGSPLMLMWGSANRDEHEFENAGELILDRPNIKNHLGFGQGIHFCIGAALARLEARVAMEVFLSRCEKLTVHLTYQKPKYLPSLFIRRLSKLEVSFS